MNPSDSANQSKPFLGVMEILKVSKWVENKIGNVINTDLREQIVEENSSFDVETYVDILLQKHFNENDTQQLKEIINQNFYDDLLYSELENSTEERTALNDSLEFDSNECQIFFEEEIIKNLENNSQDIKKKTLKVLAAAVEDFISQLSVHSWNVIMDSLQKTLIGAKDREICNMVLKIFQKVLRCPKKSQLICKGFTNIVQVIAKQIVLLNSENGNILFKKNNGLYKGKNFSENSSGFNNLRPQSPKCLNSLDLEVLIKLIWLLVDCQQQLPMKWVRFNETRFREIIFSFIHFLSSTTISENKTLSGLELLSVLNPTATWCRYYCHTAVGRSLLCSALKKYKTFFTHVVEIILNHIKINKSKRLPFVMNGISTNTVPKKFKIPKGLKPYEKILNIDDEENLKNRLEKIHLDKRNVCISSAPVEQKRTNLSEKGKTEKPKNQNSEWVVRCIPRRIVTEAVFCHSISFVTCLIQFRSGRALFPLYTPTKRLLSVQDFSFSLIEYLENIECFQFDNAEITLTSTYKAKVLEIMNILKNLRSSSRSADK